MYEAQPIQKEQRVEWLMLAAVAGLMLVGAAFIFSASTVNNPESNLWLKQVFSYGLGLSAAVVICFVPYDILSPRQ